MKKSFSSDIKSLKDLWRLQMRDGDALGAGKTKQKIKDLIKNKRLARNEKREDAGEED